MANTRIDPYRFDDAGKLILRLTVGVLVLLHGVPKLMSGAAGIVALVEGSGLPGFVGYGVLIGEVLAPLLLIAGVWTRVAAVLIACNMLVAVALVHRDHVFALTDQGGWALELQAQFLFGAVAIALLGAGRYSVAGIKGRFN
jgi:putative oxidoreductase